ncbi:1-phosphatidylinositol 3-phosphate 5-kinase [Quillaja saponaria]|uniref:1-phosphatidylinositol 3-phosphate 5-kinase n=1 Tax=Quillaja saponaria TaxID=32244 RepID=A0AAD7PRC4_QUISA|nr:1-phosphatidylinositol 3-phosphate 5-kinase [Quillaja saponaria]
MEFEKRLLRSRKPLSDCTNTNTRTSPHSSSSIRSVVKPHKHNLSTVFKKLSDTYKFGANSESTNDFPNFENASNPSSLQLPLDSTPSRPEKSSNVSDTSNCEPEPHSVYTRRKSSNPTSVQLPLSSTPSQPVKSSSVCVTSDNRDFEPPSAGTGSLILDERKTKGKAIADPFISPPDAKILNNRDKSFEIEGVSQPKAFTVPCRKKQRCMRSKSKHGLPQDFIEKQRAYFAEVDAFELAEEEVASDEELE